MDALNDLPVLLVAGLIFSMRILDVSLGTIRTISVVVGRVRLSVFLGFCEVLVWITAISQVFLRVGEQPILVVAWAGGFATGNAVGIAIERKLALGRCVVRMITRNREAVARAVEPPGKVLATFASASADGRNCSGWWSAFPKPVTWRPCLTPLAGGRSSR
jgi:uncharacterized protein YebE (UPF0316 family)